MYLFDNIGYSFSLCSFCSPQQFGDVENVTVLKDRSTGENKGFGYVRFYRPIHAAQASLVLNSKQYAQLCIHTLMKERFQQD